MHPYRERKTDDIDHSDGVDHILYPFSRRRHCPACGARGFDVTIRGSVVNHEPILESHCRVCGYAWTCCGKTHSNELAENLHARVSIFAGGALPFFLLVTLWATAWALSTLRGC